MSHSVQVTASTVVDLQRDAEKNGSHEQVTTPATDDSTEARTGVQYAVEPRHAMEDLSLVRKVMILITASLLSFASTYASTASFPASNEIAEELSTTVEALGYSNAGLILAMAFAAFIWNPISRLIGRKVAYTIGALAFAMFSIGAAMAKDMAIFTTVRVLSGFETCFFLVAGQAMVAESFDALHRGTAVGFLMAGTTSGPAIGPMIGGIIVTYTHWRVIYWLQAAMALTSLLLALIFVPWDKRPPRANMRTIAGEFNPIKVLRWLLNPNVILANIACGLLSWMMYGLLTPIRYLINPRFHLTTALVSGLCYLAPCAGFLFGTIGGGRWADMTVRRYIAKRGGVRVPEDRLHSGLLAFFGVLPIATLIYGWSLEKNVGGMPLPIIALFFSSLGLMIAFSSLNTYCAEAVPDHKRDVMASKYLIQYVLCAASTASSVPLIDTIGIGWSSTLSSLLVVIAGLLMIMVTRYNEKLWAYSKKT